MYALLFVTIHHGLNYEQSIQISIINKVAPADSGGEPPLAPFLYCILRYSCSIY